jgi:hypothetical protein
MKKLRFILLGLVLCSATAINAADITAKQLTGNWKITNLQITNLTKTENTVSEKNCYLCDLYRAKLGLIFTADGKVNYSNYGNPEPVSYQISGNVLSLFTEADAKSAVQFNVTLNNDVLTLTHVTPQATETYTFTK